VFSQNLNLIRDRRLINLLEGMQILAFEDASTQIKPATALTNSLSQQLDGGMFRVYKKVQGD
jgi:hypothetical protein